MKTKVGIIVLIVVAIILFAYFGPLSLTLLGDGEYHTGFSNDDVNNCETIHKRVGCNLADLGCWYGNVDADYPELIMSPMNNAPIVTVMRGGEGKRSVDVTVLGTITYAGVPLQYWYPDWGWYEVDIRYSSLEDWHQIISTKDNRMDESIVGKLEGDRNKQKYLTADSWGVIPGTPQPYIYKILEPIVFNIKDTQVGILRVRQYTKFSALLGLLHETKVTSEDYAFLISGEGTVEKVDAQDRYIAGEDTVRFRATTGYSGYTQGGVYTSRGWVLTVYDNAGNAKKTWVINDDKQRTRYDKDGKTLDYAIPADAVTPGTSHTWTVVLTNTLFDQSHEEFFAVTREELEQAPDMKPIKFGANKYHLGDTVTIYLEGIPNPTGRNKVDGFLLNIKYGRTGVDYVEDYHLKYISATQSKATISFRASKGDTYVNVESWAFDAPEVEGGIMSEGEESEVWIMDKESNTPQDPSYWLVYVLTIIVFAIFALIALFVPCGMNIKIIILVIGAIIAIAVYIYLSANWSGILDWWAGI